ncbi:atrial natriuretic peptide-converting enzyme-like [Tubulanus polymorphus]|uniref:atrial natriuretic peptide-converting enzyme-like n=1 Tax=Tubulanus polymorphus TaxID=672921 RepID=UPI003DA1EC79
MMIFQKARYDNPAYECDNDYPLQNYGNGGKIQHRTGTDCVRPITFGSEYKSKHVGCMFCCVLLVVCIYVTVTLTLCLYFLVFHPEIGGKYVKEKYSTDLFQGNIKVIGGPFSKYSAQLGNENSLEYNIFKENFQFQIDRAFKKSSYSDLYNGTQIMKLTNGSVKVDFVLKMKSMVSVYEDTHQKMEDAVRLFADTDGTLGPFVVDKLSINITSDNPLLTTSVTPAPTLPSTTTVAPTNATPVGECTPMVVNYQNITCSQFYNFTAFPNLLNHSNENEAIHSILLWGLYFTDKSFNCYEHAALFGCSLYLPKCSGNSTPPYHILPPCRNICEETFANCGPILELAYVAWPPPINCSDFPNSTDPGICVGGLEAATPPVQKACPEDHFKCDDGRCLPKRWRCDGNQDCEDNSDETTQCASCDKLSEYQCKSHECIPVSKHCDGVVDCYAAYDERNCTRFVESSTNGNGLVEVFNGINGTWMPVCSDRWTYNTTNAVCRQLTYSSSQESPSFNPVVTNSSSADMATLNDVTMHDPLSTKYFISNVDTSSNTTCASGTATRVTCGDIQCGMRPAYVPHMLRIVGGSEVKPGTWPWLVSIHLGGRNAFYCGGGLIHQQWVLTASHCIGYLTEKSDMTLVFGVTRRNAYSPYRQTRKPIHMVRTTNYTYGNWPNDISLIKLDRPVDFNDYVRPICLPAADLKLPAGTRCYAAGFGRTAEDGKDFSEVAREVRLSIVNRTECQIALETADKAVVGMLRDHHLCAGGQKGLDSCQGDSGTSFVCEDKSSGRWFAVGVTIGGLGCARPLPAVNIEVSKFVNWIKRNIAENS